MKGGKRSWTKKGSHYLAKILTESTNKRISSILDNTYNNVIEDQVINEIKETIQLSAKDVNKGINKGLGSEIKKCSLPYEGCALNEGRNVIRKLTKNMLWNDFAY